MNHYSRLPAFEKEFKRLFKKYRTIQDDFEKFKKVISHFPTGSGKNFAIIYFEKEIKIVKARMACRALRDRSLRVIYAYHLAISKVEFIEIYFKGEKENEDRERIKEYLKN